MTGSPKKPSRSLTHGGARFRGAAAIVVIIGLCACSSMRVTEPRALGGQVDFTQADDMLDFLRTLAAAGKTDPTRIDALMRSKGTALVIQQMNLARRVTPEQYRSVLASLTQEQAPRLEPVDASERARRGVQGLTRDVWPALRWGRDHADLLAARVRALRESEAFSKARMLAERYLPGPVKLSPSFHVVMGGRAGFAALKGNEITFDVLALSFYRAMTGRPYGSDTQILEYLAHEFHHLGLAEIIGRTRESLRLDGRSGRSFGFLETLASEGSASYLINGHRDLREMREDPSFSDYLKDPDALLDRCEAILRAVLRGGAEDDDAFDQLTTPMLGNGYHATGSVILSVIDRAGGLEAVMAVLRDPRRLATEYNRAAALLNSRGEQLRLLDSEVAAKTLRLGDETDD